MPIYVYGCRKCGAVEEHIQRFSDPPKTKCEACGGKLEKQVTSAAFHLKGGGWYRDGYASARPDGGGGGDAAESSPSESAGADTSAAAKSDAKVPGTESASPKAEGPGQKKAPENKGNKKKGPKKKASA